MGRAWALTGRVEELRFIDAASRRAEGPRGVVLAGTAGVGKTRLAREALAVAEQRGMAARWATATASAHELPLGAFAAILGAVRGDPTQVLRQATDALLADAGRAGVVVGVDDAHLLDELSALLVHQLVLRQVATVVVTVRTGEPSPDAVTALWKDGHLDRLEVQPLSEPETGALLEVVLHGPVDSASIGRLWRVTGGNALYLQHLVDGELEAGRLRKIRGVWCWSGSPALSPGLTELVTARMGALPEAAREVVDLLALDEPLGVILLAKLTDPATVEQAETRGLVRVERDGRRLQARLAHPLYGEARRADIGQLRARRLRGRIATVLADTGARRADDTLRLAVLALDSDFEPDPLLLTAAARSAIRLGNLSLAERLARAGVAAGGGFDAQLTCAYALTWLARGVEAEAELAALDQLVGNDAERILIAIPRAGNLFWILRRPDEAEASLDRAEAMISSDTARAVLASMRAAFHGWLGRPHQAMQCAADALASDSLPDQSVVLATWGLVAAQGVIGRADAADRAAARGYDAAGRIVDGAVLGLGLGDLHIVGLRLAGYLHEAESVARRHHEDTNEAVGPTQPMGVALLGHAALARGRLRASIQCLRDARAGLSAADPGGWSFRCLMSLTQALAMAGDTAAAREALAELEAEHHPGFVFLEPEIVLARACVAAAQGAVSEAVTLAHEAASIAAGLGQFGHEVLALQAAVCLGDRTVAGRLAELTTQVDGPRAPAAAAHAAALSADDGDALEVASVQLERMGDLLAAADAAAQAATAHTHHGRRGAAHAAAARAHRLAEACEGPRTPALIAAALPLPLTEREREIVTLAAQGLSNQQIADRLVVSVRTIEGHLYRAGTKLGTTSRAEFAAVLRGD